MTPHEIIVGALARGEEITVRWAHDHGIHGLPSIMDGLRRRGLPIVAGYDRTSKGAVWFFRRAKTTPQDLALAKRIAAAVHARGISLGITLAYRKVMNIARDAELPCPHTRVVQLLTCPNAVEMFPRDGSSSKLFDNALHAWYSVVNATERTESEDCKDAGATA